MTARAKTTKPPELCALVHEATPCGQPATTTGPLGSHHEDTPTGPLCARCAFMQEIVMGCSRRGGTSRISPTHGVLMGDTP